MKNTPAPNPYAASDIFRSASMCSFAKLTLTRSRYAIR